MSKQQQQLPLELPDPTIESIHPDWHLSLVKPLHAHWLVEVFAAVKEHKDLIQSGWRFGQ